MMISTVPTGAICLTSASTMNSPVRSSMPVKPSQ